MIINSFYHLALLARVIHRVFGTMEYVSHHCQQTHFGDP